jgi:hypothetical protein
MASEKTTDPKIRLIGQITVTALLWAATFVATKADWLAHPDGLPLRMALVAIGVGGFLPVMVVYVKSIRMQDEFTQRIHLVALSVAFALTAVVSYTCDLLHQAGFIPALPATGLWAVMVAIWFVSMIATERSYR